jgi:hypothetical protein
MDDSLLQEALGTGTSSERLRHLLNQTPLINAQLAKNPATPPDVLKILSSSNSNSIRESVAENPNTPLKVLFHLGAQYPKQLLRNPALPLILLENPNTFTEIPSRTLLKLIEQPEAPRPLLEWAATLQGEPGVRRKVAANPNTPSDTLERLAGDHSLPVREAILNNPKAGKVLQLFWRLGASRDLSSPESPDTTLPSQDLERLALGGSFARYLVAKHPNTTASTIHTLAQSFHSDVALRIEVAQHPNTPSEVLQALLGDVQVNIRGLALRHPNTPSAYVEILHRLGADETLSEYTTPDLSLSQDELVRLLERANHWVRVLVARHPNLPYITLQALSNDSSLEIKLAVAQNPATTSAILEQYATTHHSALLAVVAAHSNLSEKTLNILWNGHSSSPDIRRAVIRHPRAKENFLQKAMLWIDDKQLRQKASKHPNAPQELLSLLQKAGASADLSEYTYRAKDLTQEELHQLIHLGGFAKSLAARHPKLDETLLQQFSVAQEDWLLVAVASRQQLSRELQKMLSGSFRLWVREALAENQWVLPEILEELAQDTEVIVRWAVSRNVSAPILSLQQLTQDANEKVRGSALRTLQLKK